ncbi:MAG: N-acetyltransferase, partial [Promethearchaeota archaeon]
MKNIIIKTQKLDDQVDLQELASLTVDLWKKIRPELDPSADRLMQWMKNLKYTHPPVIVKAYKEEVLVGWLMLFKQDTKMLEINPWALGGHPHIIHNHPNEIEIARLLLNSCVEYAETNEYTRVEILFDKKDNERNYPVELEIYSDRYLLEEDEIQYMSRSIEIHEYSMPKFPEGIKIVPFMDCSQEDLYQCLYASYKESGDRNFKSKTDDERREFFSNLCDPKNEIIEHASIALIKKGKLVGFSLVRPTHGENNGHLWIICILPEFRKKTLASSILRFAIVTLGKMGYQTMSLTVDCENTPAVNLYEKFKFERGWARLTYAWKKENAKKMKDEFLLSTEFSLERCDIEKFSKNWAIYSSFSEWDDFETRKKIISRMGDHINNTYWIWHRKTSRIGGLLLRPNGLGYLFFEPPF